MNYYMSKEFFRKPDNHDSTFTSIFSHSEVKLPKMPAQKTALKTNHQLKSCKEQRQSFLQNGWWTYTTSGGARFFTAGERPLSSCWKSVA